MLWPRESRAYRSLELRNGGTGRGFPIAGFGGCGHCNGEASSLPQLGKPQKDQSLGGTGRSKIVEISGRLVGDLDMQVDQACRGRGADWRRMRDAWGGCDLLAVLDVRTPFALSRKREIFPIFTK